MAGAEVSHGGRDAVNVQYTIGRNGHACKAAGRLEELQYREGSGLAPAPDSNANYLDTFKLEIASETSLGASSSNVY